MEEKVMKRLYVGGLGHTISQKDLKDRFGKFGDVSDVEIVTRKDEGGTPFKVFAYININILDADFRKCLTVLNKSKWKGGTLQIEMAKESFLHRLALERQQQAAEKTPDLRTDPKESLVESFKNAGVENFHMKAAVPGTEIPGHKDWVVSKFGRVLPVLHLRGQGKNKAFKYDPSKHSHNIKKLESSEVTTSTPVSQLTWEIQGGDDEISRKRRGEFPSRKLHPAKVRKGSLSKAITNSYPDTEDSGVPLSARSKANHNVPNVTGENGSLKDKMQASALKKPQRSLRVSDGECDTDEEIKVLEALEKTQNKDASAEEEHDLEVVGCDFLAMPSVFQARRTNGKKSDCATNSFEGSDDEQEYDSADTDEILTRLKTASEQKASENAQTDTPALCLKERKSESATREFKASKKVLREHLTPVSDSSGNDEDSDGSVDSEYEAMMGNCYRLDLSLADLEKLSKEHSDSAGEDNGVSQASDSQGDSGQLSEVLPPPKKRKAPVALPAKKGNTPEEILAALFEDSSSNDESSGRRKKKKKKTKEKTPSLNLPEFKGTKTLSGVAHSAESGSVDCLSGESDNRTISASSPATEDERNAVGAKPPSFKGLKPIPSENETVKVAASRDVMVKTYSGPRSSDEEMEVSANEHKSRTKIVGRTERCTPKRGSQPNTSESMNSVGSSTSESESESGEEAGGDAVATAIGRLPESAVSLKKPSQSAGRVAEVQKRQVDNQKRLAALELRQKEAEQQKKLIQGALSKVDTPVPSVGKHIVFESDDGSEEEADSSTVKAPSTQTKSLFKDSSDSSEDGSSEDEPGTSSKLDVAVKEVQKHKGSELFNSDEDEDEDGDRFQIKPQFEGKAGQKLMQLQARYGTDERFRMDSRFLENNDVAEATVTEEKSHDGVEVQLEEEKKKNLDILQSLLHVNIQTAETSKEKAKGKTFKDISALHYDPTREDHAAFETKSEEPTKESKAARRKKREATEKLPEVSKDIYYNVAENLKDVFSSSKGGGEDGHASTWDEEKEAIGSSDGEADAAMQLSLTSNVQDMEEESTGFKFSFFNDGADKDSTVKEDYKFETLKGAKVSWQVDHRFRDSSSEEEEEESKEKTEDETTNTSVAEEPMQAKKTFFFFFKDDERLKDGPKMFCRLEKLEAQRGHWEENRSSLIEEYRKKHKDARRRVKISLKS